MAAKKKTTPISDGEPKAKGLFDHIRHIREVQDPNYFDTLTDKDLKSWSNYMICRFLSMDSRNIDVINEIQKYSALLEPKYFYLLCIEITPKCRSFSPYIKGKSNHGCPSGVMEYLKIFFEERESVICEYLTLMSEQDVKNILAKYGIGEAEYKDLIKK